MRSLPRMRQFQADDVERNRRYDDYTELRIAHSSLSGGTDAGRTRSAKIWLVWRCEFSQNGAGDAETGVQTGMALGQPDYPWRGGWWSLPGVWVLDTLWSGRGCGRDVPGGCQGPFEAPVLVKECLPGV